VFHWGKVSYEQPGHTTSKEDHPSCKKKYASDLAMYQDETPERELASGRIRQVLWFVAVELSDNNLESRDLIPLDMYEEPGDLKPF